MAESRKNRRNIPQTKQASKGRTVQGTRKAKPNTTRKTRIQAKTSNSNTKSQVRNNRLSNQKKVDPASRSRWDAILTSLKLVGLLSLVIAFLIGILTFFNKTIDHKKQSQISTHAKKNLVKAPFLFFYQFDETRDRILRRKVFRKDLKGADINSVFQALLKGPNLSEKRKGLVSALSKNCKLLDLKYNKHRDTLVINFSKAFEENGSRQILQKRIEQVVYTATQFKRIKKVSIKIGGKQKSSLSGDGVVLPDEMTRETIKYL